MKRRQRVMGRPLKPMPKWSSLKEGDTVMELGGRSEPCTLVHVKRFKQVWGTGAAAYTVYHKKGTFLNLTTGETFELDLDGVGIRGEVVRAPREGGA